MGCIKKVDSILFLNKMRLIRLLSATFTEMFSLMIDTVLLHSYDAGIAQLVEHNLAKVGVGSSSLLSRSIF